MEMSVAKKSKPGSYANINAKRARIKAGSGEEDEEGWQQGCAPTAKDFQRAQPKPPKQVKK
jgi:hypothetical protein